MITKDMTEFIQYFISTVLCLDGLACLLFTIQFACGNFFGIIVLQFVGHLLGGSMAGLMVTSSKRPYATGCVTVLQLEPLPRQ